MRATFRGRERKRNGKEKPLRRQSQKGRKRGIRLLQGHQELKLMITLQIMKSRLDRIRLFKRSNSNPISLSFHWITHHLCLGPSYVPHSSRAVSPLQQPVGLVVAVLLKLLASWTLALNTVPCPAQECPQAPFDLVVLRLIEFFLYRPSSQHCFYQCFVT